MNKKEKQQSFIIVVIKFEQVHEISNKVVCATSKASDQPAHTRSLHLEFLSLKGGCRGSSEPTHVKMPHCLKSHALAHLLTS